uniref:Putative ovule protein n=1 Tax=Solanum chacoense TaxID=4108 RepID=A0A0V0HL42_SOLCH
MPCLLVFSGLICTQLHDGSPLEQSLLDSSKLIGSTRVLAYSSFIGLFVPNYNFFPYKRKKGL